LNFLEAINTVRESGCVDVIAEPKEK